MMREQDINLNSIDSNNSFKKRMGTKTGVSAPITLINLTYYYGANVE